MDNIKTKIYKCVGSNEEEIHIYKDNQWLFGIRRDLVQRADIVEIMKLFKLNYPYTFLNEL
jgi:hypothetical protein